MPYAPSVQNNGADYLFQGISQAGAGIARGFEQMMARKEKEREEVKRIATNGKLARQTFKNNPDLLPPGMTPDHLEAMSASDAADLLQGQITAVGLKRYQQQAQAAEREAVTAQALQQFAQDFASPEAGAPNLQQLQDYFEATSAEQPEMPQASPDARMLFALRKNPQAFASPQFDNSMQGLLRFLPGQERNAMPRVAEIEGNKFVYNPQSGNFAPLNPEKKPEKDSITPMKFRAKLDRLKALNGLIYDAMSQSNPNRQKWLSERDALQKEIDEFQNASTPPADAANPEAQKLIEEANAAIAAGAPRDKVLARLREKGIEVK